MPIKSFAVFIVLVFGVSGCGQSSGPSIGDKIGKNCTVQFRRGDALGGAAALPVPPTTNGINGAEVSISGTLVSADSDWVAIKGTTNVGEIWIPRSSILLVQFQSP